MRLQECHSVGSVCAGGTSLMCRDGNVKGWVRKLDVSPSTCRWTVEVYVPNGPHRGSVVVFGYTNVTYEHSGHFSKGGGIDGRVSPRTGASDRIDLDHCVGHASRLRLVWECLLVLVLLNLSLGGGGRIL